MKYIMKNEKKAVAGNSPTQYIFPSIGNYRLHVVSMSKQIWFSK